MAAALDTDLDFDDPTAVRDLKKVIKQYSDEVGDGLKKFNERVRRAASSSSPPPPPETTKSTPPPEPPKKNDTSKK